MEPSDPAKASTQSSREEEKSGSTSPHLDPLEADREIIDYEDFLDVARRSHLKLAANIAEAMSTGETYIRRRLGIPDPREDRTSPRLPGPGDALFELGRLHLEYLDKLANLTKEIGADAHRYLEGLFAKAAGSAATKAPKLSIDVFESKDADPYEPCAPELEFELQNDWKAGALITFGAGRFVDMETGVRVPDSPQALLTVSPGRAGPVALGGRVRATAQVRAERTHLRLHHTYRAPIEVMVDGDLRQIIEVVVRVLPKIAIPTVEFWWDGAAFIPPERWFPVSYDSQRPGTFVIKVNGQIGERWELINVRTAQWSRCTVSLDVESSLPPLPEGQLRRVEDVSLRITPKGSLQSDETVERDVHVYFRPNPPDREELLARVRVRARPAPKTSKDKGASAR